jgi:hypothetical protein
MSEVSGFPLQPSNAIKLVLQLLDTKRYWKRDELTTAVLDLHKKSGGVEGLQKPQNVITKVLSKLHAEKKIEQVARGMWTKAASAPTSPKEYQESDFDDYGDAEIENESKGFSKNHILTYMQNVGKPLNIIDENGHKTVPPENREAQFIIKDAHRLVKVWAEGIRDKLFPEGTNPEKTITATNQRGNFRDYLPQTFEPSKTSPTVISYWVYLWSDRESENNDMYFRVTLGVNEDKADLKLKRKVEQVRNNHGGANNFTAQLPALEGAKLSMDELVDWGVGVIKNFPLTYDEFCSELEPELSASESMADENVTDSDSRYWIEKTLVKGRNDREYGPECLGKALWSPQKSKGERQADIYSNMRKVQAGDVIFHFTDNKAITGISIAADKADTDFVCLEGTDWAGLPGYRVALKDYKALDKPITREEIFSHVAEVESILANSNGLFYNKDLKLVQGGYLTAAPIQLVELFNQIYRQNIGENLPYVDVEELSMPEIEVVEEYGVDDALNGLLISRPDFEGMIDSIKNKKNLILQGPPGTGKSFVAKRLAYAVLGEKDDARVQSIQFHQSFSYEDFIQGFRPKKDASGFTLRNGVFYRFCLQALQNPSKPFVFIIDEINRGNLSKIFGEVMLLIESDKRGPDWAVALTYGDESAKKFYIPANVHILGMMNTADRSLAIVDYALRRRFVFKDVLPGFDSSVFKVLLESRGVDGAVIELIRGRIGELNKKIESSPDLGSGFLIGHSFFVPTQQIHDSNLWYNNVIKNEIAPLLREYWFDKKRSELDQEIELLIIK